MSLQMVDETHWGQCEAPLNLSGVKRENNMPASYQPPVKWCSVGSCQYSKRGTIYRESACYYNTKSETGCFKQATTTLGGQNTAHSSTRGQDCASSSYPGASRENNMKYNSCCYGNGASYLSSDCNTAQNVPGNNYSYPAPYNNYNGSIGTQHHLDYNRQYSANAKNSNNNVVSLRKLAPYAPRPGLVVKGGKRRIKNMFTGLFAHCQVCGDRATGFHYGADTCEACKVRSVSLFE